MLEQSTRETLLSSPVDDFFAPTWNTFPTPSESEMASDSEGSTSSSNPVLGRKVDGSDSTGSPSLFPELDDVDPDELEFFAAGAGSPMISPDDLLDGSLLLGEKTKGYEPVDDHANYSKSVSIDDGSDGLSDSENIDNALAVSGIIFDKIGRKGLNNNGSFEGESSVESQSSKITKSKVHKPCTRSVVKSIKAKAEGSVKVKAGQKEQAFKIGSSLYVPFKGRNDEPRPTKNAIQAKINREKKKAYITALEEEVTGLKSENSVLQATNARMNERCDNLQREVDYLRKVLTEESSIAAVLQNIGDIKGFKVSSTATRKRKSCDDFPIARKQSKSSSGGVCLHVKDKHVSVEFCAMCAENAANCS